MAIILTCNCGRTVQARNEDAGKQARCPACGTILTVPYPDEMPLPTREPLPEPASPPPPSPAGLSTCAECGGLFPSGEVFSNAGRLLCRRCHRDTIGDPDRDRKRDWDRDRDREDDRDRRPLRRRDQEDDYEVRRGRGEKVPDYMAPAILVTLFCCMIGGIMAIVKASEANSAAAVGDYDRAWTAAESAKTWCWVSAIAGPIVTLVLWSLMAAAAAPGGRGF